MRDLAPPVTSSKTRGPRSAHNTAASPTPARPTRSQSSPSDPPTPPALVAHRRRHERLPPAAAVIDDDAADVVRIILPAGVTHARVYFDGGFRDGRAAGAAVVVIGESDIVTFRTQRVTGPHVTAYLAEAFGARLALQLARELLRDNPALRTVDVYGDNHAVVTTLASRQEALRAVPGRSAAPATWADIEAHRKALDVAQRASGATVNFVWLARAFNALADAAATAAILGREPVWPSLKPPPKQFDKPTPDQLRSIAIWATTAPVDSLRSIPPAMAPLWRAALSRVVAWELPGAIVLAPRVLLRRDGVDLRTKLLRLSAEPRAPEQYFFNAAHSPLPAQSATAAAPQDVNWALVEKLACQAPARALKKMAGSRAFSPEDPVSIAEATARTSITHPASAMSTEGVPLPAWANTSVILAVVGRDLARLAAPGVDGWTRELLLPSVDRGNATAFEGIINAIVRNQLAGFDSSLRDVLRGARLAMWAKEKGARVIGMTSVITKAAWKIAISWHLKTHNPPNNQVCRPGGVFPVLRRVDTAVRSGHRVYVADVVDAYWNVRRARVHAALVASNSPVAFIFSFVYGEPSSLYHGSRTYTQRAGVLPGCAGAAFAFAVDLDELLAPIPARMRADVAPYADDITCFSAEAFGAVVECLTPARLSKAKIIDSHDEPATATLHGVPMALTPAIKHLGAFVGRTDAAVTLMMERAAKMRDRVHNVMTAPLIAQVKWRLFRSLMLSLQWLHMATHPTVTAAAAPFLDAMVHETVDALVPEDATLTHKSCLLITTPTAAGGLGLWSFALDGAQFYDLATAAVNHDVRPLTIRKALSEAQLQRAYDSGLFAAAEFSARKDTSAPWFDVAPLTKKTRVSDEAWTLAMANFLLAEVEYGVCPAFDPEAEESSRDHSQTCHRCAGPFRHQRHQRVVAEFVSASSKYGVVATTNFRGVFGLPAKAKQPDIIVHRTAVQKKTLLLDVTVPHQAAKHRYDALNFMRSQKLRKYATFDEDNDTQTVPLVLSTVATLEDASLPVLTEIGDSLAAKRGFTREVVARMKLALVFFEAYRRKALRAKKLSGHWNDDNSHDSE